MTTNTSFLTAIQELIKVNINPYYVGGCVRDLLLGIESDDIDIVLVGVKDKEVVTNILKTDQVGNTFPVWIATFGNEKFDFALARTEQSTGDGYNDFTVQVEAVTLEEDLFRRDLSINAIAMCCATKKIIDPYGGVQDLKDKISRPVSDAFAEDPLRVLRAARFCARFGLTPTQSLLDACAALSGTNIANERVGKELAKLMEQTDTPSIFFRFLDKIGWLKYHFQELEALKGIQQDPIWHPEGDAFEHTLHCMDAATDPFTRVVMLCHDLGKATTTIFEDGKWKAPNHAKAGVAPTMSLLGRIVFKDKTFQAKVVCLVENHMVHTNTEFTRRAVSRMVRKLAEHGLTYDQLVEVCRCDVSGRPPLVGHTPYIGQDLAVEIKTSATTPIVTGDMLIALGWVQGRELGQKLTELRDLQDEGKLTEDNWLNFV